MTSAEGRRIKVGTGVRWIPTGELGTVVEKGDAGLRVAWADGKTGIYLYYASTDPFGRIEKVK